MVSQAGKLQRVVASGGKNVEAQRTKISRDEIRVMDDDLKAIVSIPEEIEGECTSGLVSEEWKFAEGDDILPFTV